MRFSTRDEVSAFARAEAAAGRGARYVVENDVVECETGWRATGEQTFRDLKTGEVLWHQPPTNPAPPDARRPEPRTLAQEKATKRWLKGLRRAGKWKP